MNGNRRRVSYIRVALGGIANCWRAHPPLFVGLMIVSALLCAVGICEIYAMRHLFDAVAEFAQGRMRMQAVAQAAMPMAIVLAASPLVSIAEYLGQGYFWRRGSGHLLARYHACVQRIPLIDFEKTETFEQMHRARTGAEDAPSASRTVVQFAFHFVPYLVFTSAFLAGIKPLLLAALLIIFASVVLAQMVRADTAHRFEAQNAGLRWQTEYFESCVTGKAYAKETRTLGAVRYFFSLFMDSMRRFHKASMETERRIARVELLLRSVNVAGYAGILALLVYYVAEGSVSVGAFASVFYSVERISGVLKDMVEQFGEALKEMGAASFTHEMLRIPEEKGDAGFLDKRAEIRLDHLSFAYPGGGSVLKDVTLTIPQGETLAIVGENGAGKTTLTKLIIGLYRPTSGTVRYGGKDIHRHIAKSRFDRISGVFQDFVRYKMTARENIAISDADARNDVAQAAGAAGANLAHLAKGLDTTLSREFGGVELSGGQWQRVAIARGLYRGHDVIVLDEPTAAIDPIEESNIFRLFNHSAQGKTVLLVTHRLGSAKIADRILLMEEGQIRELGTHEQLMAKGGKYARMYREQAGWYAR